MPLKLNVNNETRTVDVPPDTPLLWVLRDVLDLKGAKYGCGIGVCGACTVLVAGKAVRSCMVHVGSVTGQAITTIEGLSADATHPVQQGFCTNHGGLSGVGWLRLFTSMLVSTDVALQRADSMPVAHLQHFQLSEPCLCPDCSSLDESARQSASEVLMSLSAIVNREEPEIGSASLRLLV